MSDNDLDDRPVPTYRSNGSILSDMGQTQQRFEREQAEQRAALEIKLRDWSELEQVLLALIQSVEAWDRSSNEAAFQGLNRIYAGVMPTLIAPPKGSATYIRNLRNEIVSTREALGTSSYTKKELRRLELTWPQTALEKTRTLISRAERKINSLQEGEEEQVQDPLDSMVQTLTDAQQESGKLSLLKSTDHVVIRAPVVIIGASISALVKHKIPHHNLGGYAALRDQRVIGVHNDLVERTKKGKAKETLRQAVERLLEQYSKQTGHLTIINPHPVVSNGGVWFWIGSENEIERLRKAIGPALISPWGFAQ